MTSPMTSVNTQELDRRRVGLWLIGARGSIATCVTYGLAGLTQGVLDPIGIATAHPPFERIPWVPLENLVCGGWDVCRRDVTRSAGELVAERVLDAGRVETSSRRAAACEHRLRPGILDAAAVGMAALDPAAARLGALPPREQVAALIADLDAFQRENELARVIVVNVASTEAIGDARPEWAQLGAFERALDDKRPQPASVLYAYAALSSGRPHVNFTPSLGASIPALRELARERGVPHCGNDGKTGETLLKTVLAPMFRARALRVLTWQGYNMLGNRDGQVLRDPAHSSAKLANKDSVLRSILGRTSGGDLHSHVAIDYVPSLRDWKTAWDFVHFEGFLGARMSLQLTWQGSDSALAAPLVLDLVRLTEYAALVGEAGEMPHTGCFFKAPIGDPEHDFHEQFRRLVEYAERHDGKPR